MENLESESLIEFVNLIAACIARPTVGDARERRRDDGNTRALCLGGVTLERAAALTPTLSPQAGRGRSARRAMMLMMKDALATGVIPAEAGT